MEYILINKSHYVSIEGGWQKTNDDHVVEAAHVWDTRDAAHESEAISLLDFDKEFSRVFGREKSSSVQIVRHDKLIKAYLGTGQQDCKTAYLDSLSLDSGFVCVERILDDDGTLLGAMVFTVGNAGTQVKCLLEDDNPTWKRELITARKEGVIKYMLPKWVHEKIGEDDEIAGTAVEVVYEPVIPPLLEKSVSKCVSISYSEWKKREATKTKAKSFLNYALIGFGILCYGAVSYMDMDTEKMTSARLTLDREVSQLVAKREEIEKNRFFVDWVITPSVVDLLKTVTSSLGSVQITEMKADVKLGKYAKVEGTAIALDGRLRPKQVEGMQVDAVMTKGKVGLHFALERKVER